MQALCYFFYFFFLQKQIQDMSLLRIFQLSKIVLHPLGLYRARVRVCVCVCVGVCVGGWVSGCIFYIVMLVPFLMSALCVSFLLNCCTFSISVYIMRVTLVQRPEPHGRRFTIFPSTTAAW